MTRWLLLAIAATLPAALDSAAQAGRALRTRYAAAFPQGPYVLEYASVSALVADWSLTSDNLDPFGLVLWPGADALAELIASEVDMTGLSVVELGCGTGLCSLVAASQGASKVLATDANPEPLELVAAAAAQQRLTAVRTEVFNMCAGAARLPSSIDLVLAADVCYSDTIARALAARCAEASAAGVRSLVTDSVNIARKEFARELTRLGVEFEQAGFARTFTGHAVSLDMEVERNCSVALFRIAPQAQQARGR